MKGNKFIPYNINTFPSDLLIERSKTYYEALNTRRSIRTFSDKPIPKEVIENIIMTASSAPSGANKQPWTFCAISNPDIKAKIREAAEKEEYTNYNGRMSKEWLEDLMPFETNWEKPFLEIVPWLIVVFRKNFELEEGQKKKNYYVNESVGLAAGFLLTAIHNAGLVSLTHTPSPMGFLQKILNRPDNEKPFLLIPVGYPAENAQVPDISRKTKEDVIVFFE